MNESLTLQSRSDDKHGAGVLRLSFEKVADRWSHRFEWVRDDKCVVLLTSVEGLADTDWPPSPPLQEISEQDLGSQTALLGVGMAGRSHWSISCTTEHDSESESIVLDLACLCKDETGGWLGSTYSLHPNVVFDQDVEKPVREVEKFGREVEAPAETKLFLKIEGQEFEIQTRSGDGWNTSFSVDDRLLKISPVEISESPKVATRWAFCLKASRNRA